MSEPYLVHEVVGFDYAQSVRELTRCMTYEALIEQLGYESRSSINNILKGAIPDHPHGEALYALYRNTFGCKPPLKVHQKVQLIQQAST